MEKDNVSPEMPPADAPYLLDYFWEMGPSVGEHALTWEEIDRWCVRTGIDLSPWECRTIARLSREYLSESRKATELNYPAPWQPEVHTVDKAVKADKLRDTIRGLAKL